MKQKIILFLETEKIELEGEVFINDKLNRIDVKTEGQVYRFMLGNNATCMIKTEIKNNGGE